MPDSLNSLKAYRADPYSYAEARALGEELELSEPVAVTLVRRGYRTAEEARRFLAADESHSPAAFDSMAEVTERVLAAVREGRRITVHGDFDVDGVCATTVMVSALRGLGATCDWLIPDRLADGYGLSAANVERLAQRGTSLLLTVDCGITAAAEVRLAQELGIEVVVTDHHQPGGELPDCPILHPELERLPVRRAVRDGGRLEAGVRSPVGVRHRVPGRAFARSSRGLCTRRRCRSGPRSGGSGDCGRRRASRRGEPDPGEARAGGGAAGAATGDAGAARRCGLRDQPPRRG